MFLTNRVLRVTACFFLVLCIFIHLGCGLTESQRKNTANFSRATSTLAEITSKELVQMRNGVIEMNTNRLAAVGEETGQPMLNNLDESFDVETVKVRIQAVEVLKNYGELLQLLVEDSQEQELKKASDKFVASINGLPDVDKRISDEESEALGQAVYLIGRVIVETKKAKAVREIVNNAHAQVEHLCTLLSRDFDVNSERLLTQYRKSGNIAIGAIRQAFLESNDVLTRLELVELYKKTQANRDRTETIAKSISIAVANMKNTNTALKNSLEENALSLNVENIKDNIKTYQKSVKEVIDLIKVLRQSRSD